MLGGAVRNCVVFDLDDTLYDEIDYIRSGYRAVARAVFSRFGVRIDAELESLVNSRRWHGALTAIADGVRLPESALPFMIATYRAHLPNIRLRDGVADVLHRLLSDGAAIGCITDGESVRQRQKLDALGLSEIMSVVVVSEEVGADKRSRVGFEEVVRQVDAQRYWYVGDNPEKDFIVPNALGWSTIGVRSVNSIRLQDVAAWPASHQPQAWISVREISDIVDKICGESNHC